MQISIKLISKLVSKLKPQYLADRLPQFLPGLYQAFKNPSADVRKAVVFTLVELYMALGDAFTPHLNQLNTAQLKLVTIYINRQVKKQSQRASEYS